MTKDERQEIANDFINGIKEAFPDIDFRNHERRKKVRRSFGTIMLDRGFDKQKQLEHIESYVKWGLLNGLLEYLKEGKSIPPQYHDESFCDCDFAWWRNQFLLSSADDEYHVLVTVEIGSYSLEITFEMEVE